MRNDDRLSSQVGKLLLKRNETLAAAESCTGGLFSEVITRIPGSSDYFRGSFVPYQLTAKEHLLKIQTSLLKKYNGVSGEIAVLMAERIRKAFKSDWGVGITGFAGPSGGTKYDPVGAVYIAVARKKSSCSVKFKFSGSRTKIQKNAAVEALKLLKKTMEKP